MIERLGVDETLTGDCVDDECRIRPLNYRAKCVESRTSNIVTKKSTINTVKHGRKLPDILLIQPLSDGMGRHARKRQKKGYTYRQRLVRLRLC